MGVRLPTFCDSLPWKAMSIAVGIIMLVILASYLFTIKVFSSVFFLDSLVMAIRHSSIDYDEHGTAFFTSTEEVFRSLLINLSYEYGATLQITFAIILTYGCLTEKSAYVHSWLIVQIAVFINAILYIRHFIMEDLIILGILLIASLGVLKYYSDLPKPKVI